MVISQGLPELHRAGGTSSLYQLGRLQSCCCSPACTRDFQRAEPVDLRPSAFSAHPTLNPPARSFEVKAEKSVAGAARLVKGRT